jgi:hypothetical protein
MTILSNGALRRLAARSPLPLDPHKSIAIKRNVHEFVVDVGAPVFAKAFHEVMIEPGAYFRRIQLKRSPERIGKPFEPGERFHGCFSLSASFPAMRKLLEQPGIARAAAFIEDSLLSDYAEIVDITENGQGFSATYRYLSGTPIAGFSTFKVEPDGGNARMTAVFQYQEISSVAILVLHQMAARFHDDVVLEQVVRAAKRAGGRVLSSTIPLDA